MVLIRDGIFVQVNVVFMCNFITLKIYNIN